MRDTNCFDTYGDVPSSGTGNVIRRKRVVPMRIKDVYRLICVLPLIFGSLTYAKQKIDFSALTSPIIFQGDQKYGFRDPAIAYHDGKSHHYYLTQINRLSMH